MSPDNSLDQHVVTAVVVAHDGAAWLPRVADGVLQQTRPVQRAVAVDTGSRDRSGAMLAGLFGRPAVFGMDRGTGYAAAVTHALRHRAANTHPPGAQRGGRTEWIWLLHDDCEPAPDALGQLLRAAAGMPGAAVLGPKVRDWNDRRVILEAGITIDRAGRRITGVEPREVDQGQHDGDRDVLAVSSAGMLIRRDVWDELGGFDTGMRLFREDVDFCWRAQAAGHRVRLVTGAVVYHLEASARNRRPTSAAPRPRREDRRNALVTLLGNLPSGPMQRVLAGSVVLSVLRTLFYLAAKRTGAGADEFSALVSLAAHPLRLASIRRPRAHGRRAAYSRLRSSIPAGRTLARLAEFLAGAWSKTAPVDTIGSHHATDDPSDDDSLLIDSGLAQRILTSPGVLLFLGLAMIALIAERSLLGGGGVLGGGALTPAWGGASDLWQEYLQGFHPAGIGSAASTPPYVAVLAFLATLLLGKTWLAVDVLMIGCVPLAGLTAYAAARRITRFAPARAWAAAAYALLPVGMGAVAAGRLASAVVFVLLPVIGLLAARIFTEPRRRARRAAWAAALVTAVAAAFVPLTWVVVVVLVGVGGLLFGRSRPGRGLNLAIVAVVPLLLLLPWSLQLAASPAELFLESGLQQPGLSQAGLPARSLLLLWPGGPGLPPYWVTAGLLVAAVAMVLLSGRRLTVRSGWAVALAALLTAVGISQLVITPPGGGAAVPAWPGVVLAVAGAGLVLAVAAAGGTMPDLLRAGRWRGSAGLGVLLLAALAVSAPVLAAANWVVTGVTGPVTRIAAPVLPEFVSVAADSGLRLRTLVLRAGPHGSVSYEVLRDADPLIGTASLAPPPAAQRALNTTVAALAAPSGGDATDQGQALAELGIGYVLLPAPGDPAIARLLDGVAGLRPVSQTSQFQLWRVVDTAAEVRVVEAGGKTVPVSSGAVGVSGARVPSAGGELVLAEPAGGWTATLNGQPLTPLATPAGGWAQGFRLPAGGGTLSVGHPQPGRDVFVTLQCLAVLAVAGLGLPGARQAGAQTGEAGDTARQPAAARAAAAGRPPGRRTGGVAPVPGPQEAGDGPPGAEQRAGLAAGSAAAQADSGPPAAAESRRLAAGRAGESAGGPPRAGAADMTAVTGYPSGGRRARPGAAGPRAAADEDGPAGYPPMAAGLAPQPGPGGGTAGGHPGGAQTGPGGGRGRKLAGRLLGRGRAARDEDPAAGVPETGLPPAGGHPRQRPGRGRPGPAGGPPPDVPAGGDGQPRRRGRAARYPGAGPAGQDGGYPAGRRGPGGAPGAGDWDRGGYPAGGGRGGYPAGGDRGGYPAGGGRGSYPAGGADRPGYGSDDYPAGGDRGGRGAPDGHPAAGYRDGDDADPGRRGRAAGRGRRGAGRRATRDAPGSRGYPPAGAGTSGYGPDDDYQPGPGRRRGSDPYDDGRRAGGRGAGRRGSERPGYPDGGYGGEPGRGHRGAEYRTKRGGGSGYPAASRRGDLGSGGSPAAGRGNGGYPAGGYPAGEDGTGEYGSGGYPAGEYDSGDYPGGGYGGYRDDRAGYQEDGGYQDDGYPDDDGTAGTGRGRRRPSSGRMLPGRGKPGRRPGRGGR